MPTDVTHLVSLAGFLGQAKRLDEAAVLFKNANAMSDSMSDEDLRQFSFNYGVFLFQSGKDSRAQFERVLKILDEKGPKAAQAMAMLGIANEARDEMYEAFKLLKKAKRINPKDGQAVQFLKQFLSNHPEYKDK